MKIVLRQEDSVSVLVVSGSVDSHNFLVLKAGITKLLRDGKNRIVLSLEDAKELDNDVIRELAIIDVFARELAGKIILASSSPELKESVRTFAKPPVIPILSSVDLAIDYFKKIQEQVTEADPDEAKELKAQLEAKSKQIEALEARIRLSDPSEVKNLRANNAALTAKVTMLEDQIEKLLKEKRQPSDPEGFLEKITALENTVKQLAGKT